jgi:hypothetical protein
MSNDANILRSPARLFKAKASSDTWYTLTCLVSGPHSAVISGGPTTFTLSPTTDFVSGEHCTLTILADNVSDQDVNDPPDRMMDNFVVDFSPVDVCVLSYTPIYDIQGRGEAACLLVDV